MTPDQVIAALEKHGEMQNVVQLSKNEYQGTRKGKSLTAKVIKNRGHWQLVVKHGTFSYPSNTSPWQETIFSDLHWRELD